VVRGVVVPGIGPVDCTDGRRVHPSGKHSRRGIGTWRVVGESSLPDAPAPGLAYPNASPYNPSPCGGGVSVSAGEEVPCVVELSLSTYETDAHPAYPFQVVTGV